MLDTAPINVSLIVNIMQGMYHHFSDIYREVSAWVAGIEFDLTGGFKYTKFVSAYGTHTNSNPRGV